MTELKLTKLYAEAMGFVDIQIGIISCKVNTPNPDYPNNSDFGRCRYDPLTNDSQAMALVRKFGLTIDPIEDMPPFTWHVVIAYNGDWDKQIYADGVDLNRAICECVAKMQLTKNRS